MVDLDDYLPVDPDCVSEEDDDEIDLSEMESCLLCGGLLTAESPRPYCCTDCADEAERDSEEDGE